MSKVIVTTVFAVAVLAAGYHYVGPSGYGHAADVPVPPGERTTLRTGSAAPVATAPDLSGLENRLGSKIDGYQKEVTKQIGGLRDDLNQMKQNLPSLVRNIVDERLKELGKDPPAGAADRVIAEGDKLKAKIATLPVDAPGPNPGPSVVPGTVPPPTAEQMWAVLMELHSFAQKCGCREQQKAVTHVVTRWRTRYRTRYVRYEAPPDYGAEYYNRAELQQPVYQPAPAYQAPVSMVSAVMPAGTPAAATYAGSSFVMPSISIGGGTRVSVPVYNYGSSSYSGGSTSSVSGVTAYGGYATSSSMSSANAMAMQQPHFQPPPQPHPMPMPAPRPGCCTQIPGAHPNVNPGLPVVHNGGTVNVHH